MEKKESALTKIIKILNTETPADIAVLDNALNKFNKKIEDVSVRVKEKDFDNFLSTIKIKTNGKEKNSKKKS